MAFYTQTKGTWHQHKAVSFSEMCIYIDQYAYDYNELSDIELIERRLVDKVLLTEKFRPLVESFLQKNNYTESFIELNKTLDTRKEVCTKILQDETLGNMVKEEIQYLFKTEKDVQVIFKYLSIIIRTLALKAKYFRKEFDKYDDFSLVAASRVYERLRSPRQFEAEPNKELLAKVKNVLDYIKASINFLRIDWEQKNYAQLHSRETSDEALSYEACSDFSSHLDETIDELALVDVEIYLGSIDRTIKKFLEGIPHKRDSAEWLNIYTSCVLTFLSSITLSNKDKELLKTDIMYTQKRNLVVDRAYKRAREDDVILYHLPENMRTYVFVLVNRIRKIIAREISTSNRVYINSEDLTKSMMMAEYDSDDDGEFNE